MGIPIGSKAKNAENQKVTTTTKTALTA